MSAKENLGDYYADTAYTPTKRQQWEAANPEREKVIGSRLSWSRRTEDNGTNEEYGYNNIAISQSWEAQRAEKGLVGVNVFKGLKVHYDHQSIMPPNYKASSKAFFIAMACGKGISYMSVIAFVFFLFVYSLFFAFGSIDFKKYMEIIKVFFVLLFPCFLISITLWKGGELLTKKNQTLLLGRERAPFGDLTAKQVYSQFMTLGMPGSNAWKLPSGSSMPFCRAHPIPKAALPIR